MPPKAFATPTPPAQVADPAAAPGLRAAVRLERWARRTASGARSRGRPPTPTRLYRRGLPFLPTFTVGRCRLVRLKPGTVAAGPGAAAADEAPRGLRPKDAGPRPGRAAPPGGGGAAGTSVCGNNTGESTADARHAAQGGAEARTPALAGREHSPPPASHGQRSTTTSRGSSAATACGPSSPPR